MNITTKAAPRSGRQITTLVTPADFTRSVLLRAVAVFFDVPLCLSPEQAREAIIGTGTSLIRAAHRTSLSAPVQFATLRLVLPDLSPALARATSRADADEIASEAFRVREAAAAELNLSAREIFGIPEAPQVFVGGFRAAPHDLPEYAFQGFLDAAVAQFPRSNWQFGSVMLGDAERGIHQHGIEQTAAAIRDLRLGGTHFAAVFGDPANTPFMPAAAHDGRQPMLTACLSDPGTLLTAIAARPEGMAMEDAVHIAQREMLRAADAAGRGVAAQMAVPFGGVDPTQAPVFDAAAPEANSIGAVIEKFSGVSLGLPGSKAGFHHLMRVMRDAAAEAGVTLCGFSGGSFLPVAEDAVIAAAVANGQLTYDAILSLSHVCCTGLDMAPVHPNTTPGTIANVLRDVAATHLIKGKALGVRLIVPEPDTPLDANGYVTFGGLLGAAPLLALDPESR